MRRLTILLMLAVAMMTHATDVKTVRHLGPLKVTAPVAMDSTNVKGEALKDRRLIDAEVDMERVWQAPATSLDQLQRDTLKTLHLLGFTVTSTSYSRMKVTVEGLTDMQLYVDGKKQSDLGKVELLPQTHKMVVKYVPNAADTVALKLAVESTDSVAFALGDGSEKRLPSMDDMFTGWSYGGISLSPNGKWKSEYQYTYQNDGNVQYRYAMGETKRAGGRVLEHRRVDWMPRSNEYYYTQQEADGSRTLLCVDPATMKERVLAKRIPSGSFTMAPSEDYLIYDETEDGPKERDDVYEVLNPEDRWQGWRNRTYIKLYDLKTGTMQRLTFGTHDAMLQDISSDGRRLLVMTQDLDFTKRPSSLMTLLVMTLPDSWDDEVKVDTLVARDGFINGASFSPDGNEVLFVGSAEAFGGIGKTIADDKTPNMFDLDLFVMNAKGEVRAMTRDFDPSISVPVWSKSDGMIYFTAEDRDCINLFRMNPKTMAVRQIMVPEDVVRNFEVAEAAPVMVCYGESATNAGRQYEVDLKTLKVTLAGDLSKDRIGDWKIGEYQSWEYDNGRGDKISCGYCLPADFDPSKKYPMVVHYYGGCSPTSRYFLGSYSPQLYAAHGYIALIVNPSGAAGFGQEFASRHVKTAGQGVSEDIIGATKEFCRQHSFVNDKKVGCISASYGGFMTQYMLTETDFFATGVSHAGISSHAGYWGEGHWGYSYSEVSMGDAYPWNAKDLYIDQSPLFRADRIKTPLLLTHGTEDDNVPPSESIQMFTALKRVGCPAALVMVEGQKHGIQDYKKRSLWLNSIFAWFDRWLKDEPAWWNSLYPEKKL